MKEELKNINGKIEYLFFGSEDMQKYDLKRSFDQLPNMPYTSYEEMKNAINHKKASIVINFINISYTIFSLIAKRNEKLIFLFSLYIKYFIILIMIGFAFFLSNYYLLVSIFWVFVASIFSSYYVNPPLYPFKGRRIADIALFIGIYTLIYTNNYTIPFLSFSYVLMHWSYVLHRRVYGTTLHKRAFQSEIIFRFLYIGGYINLSQTEERTSIFDVR